MKKIKTDRDLVKYGINPLIWYIHFDKRPDKATCKDCADYKSGVCKGGRNPLECMREASSTSITIFHITDQKIVDCS